MPKPVHELTLEHNKKVVNTKHYLWKGEGVKHCALHEWVYTHKGRPKVCQKCGVDSKKKRICYANINHKYKRRLEDFIPLCDYCHLHYDIDKGLRKYPMGPKHTALQL